MCRLCTQRCWLGVARHADGCQLQLELRATGYWLVFSDYHKGIQHVKYMCYLYVFFGCVLEAA